jgi:hypothetical protein
MVKLVAPSGAVCASFNGKSYPVKDGHVIVPAEAINALIGSHGFSMPTEQPEEMRPAAPAAFVPINARGRKPKGK